MIDTAIKRRHEAVFDRRDAGFLGAAPACKREERVHGLNSRHRSPAAQRRIEPLRHGCFRLWGREVPPPGSSGDAGDHPEQLGRGLVLLEEGACAQAGGPLAGRIVAVAGQHQDGGPSARTGRSGRGRLRRRGRHRARPRPAAASRPASAPRRRWRRCRCCRSPGARRRSAGRGLRELHADRRRPARPPGPPGEPAATGGVMRRLSHAEMLGTVSSPAWEERGLEGGA